MTHVISKVILENLAFHVNHKNMMPEKVVMTSTLDDRYAVSIKIGDWETLIKKEDLARLI